MCLSQILDIFWESWDPILSFVLDALAKLKCIYCRIPPHHFLILIHIPIPNPCSHCDGKPFSLQLQSTLHFFVLFFSTPLFWFTAVFFFFLSFFFSLLCVANIFYAPTPTKQSTFQTVFSFAAPLLPLGAPTFFPGYCFSYLLLAALFDGFYCLPISGPRDQRSIPSSYTTTIPLCTIPYHAIPRRTLFL